jgi:ribosomal protein S4
VRKVAKNGELSLDVFNRHISREKPRRFKRANLTALKSGSKAVKVVGIEKRTTSQSLFNNKQNFKSFYKIKMKELKKVNLANHSGSIFRYLESRLDMVVFRLGFADSIDHSRKLIKGGDI